MMLMKSVIRKRIAVYLAQTTPVYEYYQQHEKSVSIKGMGTIEDIFMPFAQKSTDTCNLLWLSRISLIM